MKKKGHYLFTVKDNQRNLAKAILEETSEEQWSQPYATMHTGQGPMNFSMLRNVAVSLKHLTGEMSLPDSTARFQQNIYAFLAPFQVDPLALAENPPSLAA